MNSFVQGTIEIKWLGCAYNSNVDHGIHKVKFGRLSFWLERRSSCLLLHMTVLVILMHCKYTQIGSCGFTDVCLFMGRLKGDPHYAEGAAVSRPYDQLLSVSSSGLGTADGEDEIDGLFDNAPQWPSPMTEMVFTTTGNVPQPDNWEEEEDEDEERGMPDPSAQQVRAAFSVSQSYL